MPTATYTPLATITLGSSASSVTFSNIPSTYRDLIFVYSGTVGTPGADSVYMRFNSDSGNNYSNVRMVGTGSTTSSYADTASAAYVAVPTNSTNIFTFITQIMDYAITDKHKTLLSRHGQDNGWVTAHAGRWANTNAITSVTFTKDSASSWNFNTGSTFSLFGVIA